MTEIEEGMIFRCIQTLNHDGKVIPLDAEYKFTTGVEYEYNNEEERLIGDDTITIEHTDPSGLSNKICINTDIHSDKLKKFFTDTHNWA